jgi:hypothetical protein
MPEVQPGDQTPGWVVLGLRKYKHGTYKIRADNYGYFAGHEYETYVGPRKAPEKLPGPNRQGLPVGVDFRPRSPAHTGTSTRSFASRTSPPKAVSSPRSVSSARSGSSVSTARPRSRTTEIPASIAKMGKSRTALGQQVKSSGVGVNENQAGNNATSKTRKQPRKLEMRGKGQGS